MANSSTSSPLKAAALMEQMKLHLATDAGKDLLKKIGLVYQLNIAPKVTFFSTSFLLSLFLSLYLSLFCVVCL